MPPTIGSIKQSNTLTDEKGILTTMSRRSLNLNWED
jgi:hypothetical protein